MDFFTTFALWLALWMVFWVPCFLLFARGVTYMKYMSFYTGYFLAATLISFTLFKNYLLPLTQVSAPFPFAALAVTYGLIVVAYAVVPIFFRRPDSLIKKSPFDYFLYLDFRYIIPKTFEILFQQTMTVTSVVMVSKLGLGIGPIIALFAVVFGIAHLGVFKTENGWWRVYFFVAPILSAAVFPVLILYLPWGFVYSFIVHMLFYLVSGVIFWKPKFISSNTFTKVRRSIRKPIGPVLLSGLERFS